MVRFSDSNSGINLNNCDREPIHIPGSVQDFGFLVEVDQASFDIVTVSENYENFTQLRPTDLANKNIFHLVADAEHDILATVLESADVAAENPLKISVKCRQGYARFDCLITKFKGRTVLEFEPTAAQSDSEFKSFYHLATKSVEKLRAATSLIELFDSTVLEIRKVTGFDRVVIYKFDEDWNGVVPAEAKSDSVSSYYDLHFPASDIPKQVRELYLLNPLRIIPTVDYVPSQLRSFGGDGSKLDLSLVALRNVSPIHIEYLRNMKVTASMSCSILKNGKLWGLVSCSHETGANYVPYERRAVCTFLSSTLSSLLAYFEDREDVQLRAKLLKIQTSLVVRMTESEKFVDGLFSNSLELMALTNSTGVAAYFDGEWRAAGGTPAQNILDQIRCLITEKESSEGFSTDSLSRLVHLTDSAAAIASGVLGFSISKSKTNFILWFRPELIQTVKWGGNPTKPVELKDDQQILHPRKSFELWKETVRRKSAEWKTEEIEAAQLLRSSITDTVLQRVEQVTKLNTELERSNIELDSFAYAASHDLKEPLRGISNYTAMILRDEEKNVSEKSKERLQTVLRLTQRSEELINSLLDYSKIGRSDLVVEIVDLNAIVGTAVDTIKNMIETSGAKVLVSDLPSIRGDRTQLNEVFTNLIVNAIKYNASSQKQVTVAALSTDDPEKVFISVEDNGIGIAPAFYGSVFKIFKRLHGKDEYGGGSGTGLTIVKKIVERHGGDISLQSEIGVGTRFLISFPKAK